MLENALKDYEEYKSHLEQLGFSFYDKNSKWDYFEGKQEIYVKRDSKNRGLFVSIAKDDPNTTNQGFINVLADFRKEGASRETPEDYLVGEIFLGLVKGNGYRLYITKLSGDKETPKDYCGERPFIIGIGQPDIRRSLQRLGEDSIEDLKNSISFLTGLFVNAEKAVSYLNEQIKGEPHFKAQSPTHFFYLS